MLKRNPSLTEQVKAHIKQRIMNERFEEGRIPSETTLAAELGVSRTTVRDALSRLELEGVIYRKQGAGTFVNEAGLQIKSRLEEIWNYEDMLAAHGYAHSTRIVSVTRSAATREVTEALGLAPHSMVVVVKKLFLADNRPVILTTNHIPAEMIARPYTEASFSIPIYQFLADFCQQHLTYYLSEIVPLIVPPWLAETFHLPEQAAAIVSFDETGFNQDNVPVVKADSYFRDDLLRLRLIRRETA